MSTITVTLVLLTCLVCPIVEMFDQWDHTVQTGNDIEYALVVLALCIGIVYSFVRYIFTFSLQRSAQEINSNSDVGKYLPSFPCYPFPGILLPTSPPALALRI
jgi:ABC-type proline/glycine betaine transport system permease subunit